MGSAAALGMTALSSTVAGIMLLAAFELRADCVPPANQSLPVQRVAQQTTMWCWAASAETIMAFQKVKAPQCEQVKLQSKFDCCTKPVPRECIFGGWPQFEKYG